MVKEPLDELRAASRAPHGDDADARAVVRRSRVDRRARCATIARDAAAGMLRPEDLDVDRFTGYLPTAALPPLDLLIRTSGEQRISNFMLWEIAYAELRVHRRAVAGVPPRAPLRTASTSTRRASAGSA